MLCWIFTMTVPEVHSTLVVFFRESVTIAGYYWKQNGEKIAGNLK